MQLYCSGAIKEPDYKSCDLVCQRRWNLVPDVEFRYRRQPHRLRALGPSVCSRGGRSSFSSRHDSRGSSDGGIASSSLRALCAGARAGGRAWRRDRLRPGDACVPIRHASSGGECLLAAGPGVDAMGARVVARRQMDRGRHERLDLESRPVQRCRVRTHLQQQISRVASLVARWPMDRLHG